MGRDGGQKRSMAIGERARRSARLAWAALVGIATLGGVIGVWQFVFGEPAQPMDTRALVAQMIADGRLEPGQADDFIALIDDTVDGDGTIATAMRDGDDAELQAIAMLVTDRTRAQGLAQLEAQAESAADWSRIAQWAAGTDDALALRAAGRAVALAPDDLDYLAGLARAQITSGSFASAERTAASIDALARTPRERIVAAQIGWTLSQRRNDPDAFASDREALQLALDDFKATANFVAPSNTIDSAGFKDEPYAIAYHAHRTLGTIAAAQEEWEASLSESENALRYGEALVPHMSGRLLASLRRGLASLHDARATAMHRLDRIDTHHEAHERAIAELEALAEGGDLPARMRVPRRLAQLALEYAWLDEAELGQARIATAIQRQEAVVSSLPDEWRQAARLETYRAMQARLNSEPEGVETHLTAAANVLRDEMLDRGPREPVLDELVRIVGAEVGIDATLDPDRETVGPQHRIALDVVDSVERRFGRSSRLDEARAHHKSLLMADHAGLDNETVVAELAQEIMEETRKMAEGESSMQPFYLYALLQLSNYAGEGDRLRYAKDGLAFAEARNAEGRLDSTAQSYLASFRERIEALESDEG